MSSKTPPTEVVSRNPEDLIPEPKEAKPKIIRSPEEKRHIINLIAQGYVDTQIIQILKEKYDITIAYKHLYYYRYSRHWADLRRTLKNHYAARPDLIDGSRKDVRARRLEYIQEEALKGGNLKAALLAGEQMRKEFVDESGGVNIYMNNPQFAQFNSLSNEEIEIKYQAALRKLEQIKKDNPNGPYRITK